MDFNSKFPLGFRFDPTDGELLTYLRWRQTDPNNVGLAFIPDIRMNVHHPSEFPGLGAVMGKGGIMYLFALWNKKYAKGPRLDRQLESNTGLWKEMSQVEPIRSSNGDKQIGTKTKFAFKVGGSSTEWHMEEYRLCTDEDTKDEDTKVSLCRVSRKCSPAGSTTKSDAKETDSYGLHISRSAAESYNCNRHYWCYFCFKWYPYDETFQGMQRIWCDKFHDRDQTLPSSLESFEYECSPPTNSEGKWQAGPSCIRDTGSVPEDVGSLGTQKDGGPPSCCDFCSAGHTPKETCRENLYEMSPPLNVTTIVDNVNTRNCQSPNHTVLLDSRMRKYIRDVENHLLGPDEEDVDSLNTRNCQSANHTILGDTPNHFLSRDTGLRDMPICSNAAKEHVDNRDTGNCQIADDPMDVDHCVPSPDQPIFFDTSEDLSQLEGSEPSDTIPLDFQSEAFEILEDLFQGR